MDWPNMKKQQQVESVFSQFCCTWCQHNKSHKCFKLSCRAVDLSTCLSLHWECAVWKDAWLCETKKWKMCQYYGVKNRKHARRKVWKPSGQKHNYYGVLIQTEVRLPLIRQRVLNFPHISCSRSSCFRSNTISGFMGILPSNFWSPKCWEKARILP